MTTTAPDLIDLPGDGDSGTPFRSVSSIWAFSFFGVLIALFLGCIWYVQHELATKAAISPEIILGQPVPAEIKTLASFKTADGLIGEFYDPTTRHKVSLVTMKRPADASSIVPSETRSLVRTIIEYDASAKIPVDISALALRYARAQFDARGALNVAVRSLALPDGRSQPIETFQTKKEVFYVMGIIERPENRTLFIALKKEQAVDDEFLAKFLGRLK